MALPVPPPVLPTRALPPQPDAALADADYQRALARIYAYSGRPRTLAEQRADRPRKLARMRRLLALLGEPQRTFPSILVGGTKGKGSTAALLAQILAEGCHVGRYTQPHLHTWCERTWVDGALIPPSDVAARLAEMEAALATLAAEAPELGPLTTFEVGTALTLLQFAHLGVEVAVLELGVGGLHDAVNVVEPLLSVITSISLDHTALLGPDVATIAAEKAGILRAGRPAVLGPQLPAAGVVLERAARALDAPLARVGHEWSWEPRGNPARGPFAVRGPGADLDLLEMPLIGRHQRDNATVAIAAACLLREDGFAMTETAIRAGLRRVEWSGRLEVLGTRPLLVADGAHNADSARRLREALDEAFAYARLWLVLGLTEGKDLAGLVAALAPGAAGVIATRADHPRAVDPRRVASAVGSERALVAPDPLAALRLARALAAPEDLVCVTGSLFLVGEAIQAARRLGMADP